jgi:hypothetical protein
LPSGRGAGLSERERELVESEPVLWARHRRLAKSERGPVKSERGPVEREQGAGTSKRRGEEGGGPGGE